jgi:hypothetical protein
MNAPTPAVAQSRALADIAALRREQIERFGHTPEADAKTPIYRFAQLLQNYAMAVMEDAQFGKPAGQMRLHTIKLAALAVATIERLDLEITREQQEQDPPW